MSKMKDANVERLQAMATPIQLSLPLTPWAQVVSPILVARTSARRALPVAQEFFSRWPTVNEFKRGFDAGPELFLLHVHGMLVPIGLAAVRTSAIMNVAMYLVRHIGTVPTRADILAIPGCGRYVADSFDLFYRGDFSIEPVDPFLAEYAADRRLRFREAEALKFLKVHGDKFIRCEDGDA